MQLILHYDETYREVKYSNLELKDIDSKMLMSINIIPVSALLYTPILIRYCSALSWKDFLYYLGGNGNALHTIQSPELWLEWKCVSFWKGGQNLDHFP